MKKVGARTVPWGTPVLMVATDDIIGLSLWFIKTNYGLCVRNSKIHKHILLLTFVLINFGINYY